MLRPLLHFLWIGVALFAVDRWWLAPERAPEPVVIPAARVEELRGAFLGRAGRMPDGPGLDARLRAEVNDELLYREARSLGFDRDDPVVQRRLVQNMRFAGADPERDAASLYAEALELGMDRSDPVVRRRLVQRMRLFIEARALEPAPTDDELRAYNDTHRESYLQPARVHLVQIFFDGEREGEAARALAQLVRKGADAGAHRDLGAAFLHGSQQPPQSQRELAQRFGPEFAARVFELPGAAWSGPVPSSYGEHLVWIREHTPETQREFGEVRTEVSHAVLAERRRRELAAALAALRERVQVIVSSPDPLDGPGRGKARAAR